MSTPIQITGNLTTDPELAYLPTGRPVARFTVAVNSRRRTEAGEWTDGETTFFPVTVWAEQAEHAAQSLTKGARVVVLGTIKARSWTAADGERAGQTLTRLEVTAEVVGASLQWATAGITKAPRVEQAAAAEGQECGRGALLSGPWLPRFCRGSGSRTARRRSGTAGCGAGPLPRGAILDGPRGGMAQGGVVRVVVRNPVI